MKNNINIAYLAPEIPALSATFVYQEILQLQNHDITVIPVSIHRPIKKVTKEVFRQFDEKTLYLYEQSNFNVIFNNIRLFIRKPYRYCKVLNLVLRDAFHVGITSHVGMGLIYRFIIAAGFVHYLKEHNVTHIHANFAHIPTDIAMYSAALHGVTYSFMSHANDLFERGWLLKEKVERSKFAVTISEYNKKYLIKNGADKDKIHVIHCGVNTLDFSDRGYKEVSTPILLGSLGRMVEKKGFDVLLLACSHLRKEGVDFILEIAGDGPLYDELMQMIDELNLTGNVKLIGSVAHAEVSQWIRNLDVFVLACKKDINNDQDGIPVVLMEAMLSGVPVITTRISGIPELISDGVTGLLCEPDNPEQLSSKIVELIHDEQLREVIHKKAVDKVKNDFNLLANSERLFELLINND